MALIGFGTIAQATAQGFLSDKSTQVVAVADPAKELTLYGYAGELIGGRDALKPYIAKF